MDHKIYTLLKKRGTIETILILSRMPRHKIVQHKFFNELNQEGSYYNAYLRVKKELLKKEIITFSLNQQNEYVIELTQKGIAIGKHIKEIETLLITKEKDREGT